MKIRLDWSCSDDGVKDALERIGDGAWNGESADGLVPLADALTALASAEVDVEENLDFDFSCSDDEFIDALGALVDRSTVALHRSGLFHARGPAQWSAVSQALRTLADGDAARPSPLDIPEPPSFESAWSGQDANTLAGPVEPGELSAYEAAVGEAFPPTLRDLWGTHDGQLSGAAFEVGDVYRLLSVAESRTARAEWLDILQDAEADEFIGGLGVRGVFFHPRWVPIAIAGTGDLIVVDLAPTVGGVRGQLIVAAHDMQERDRVAWSAVHLLAGQTC